MLKTADQLHPETSDMLSLYGSLNEKAHSHPPHGLFAHIKGDESCPLVFLQHLPECFSSKCKLVISGNLPHRHTPDETSPFHWGVCLGRGCHQSMVWGETTTLLHLCRISGMEAGESVLDHLWWVFTFNGQWKSGPLTCHEQRYRCDADLSCVPLLTVIPLPWISRSSLQIWVTLLRL